MSPGEAVRLDHHLVGGDFQKKGEIDDLGFE